MEGEAILYLIFKMMYIIGMICMYDIIYIINYRDQIVCSLTAWLDQQSKSLVLLMGASYLRLARTSQPSGNYAMKMLIMVMVVTMVIMVIMKI